MIRKEGGNWDEIKVYAPEKMGRPAGRDRYRDSYRDRDGGRDRGSGRGRGREKDRKISSRRRVKCTDYPSTEIEDNRINQSSIRQSLYWQPSPLGPISRAIHWQRVYFLLNDISRNVWSTARGHSQFCLPKGLLSVFFSSIPWQLSAFTRTYKIPYYCRVNFTEVVTSTPMLPQSFPLVTSGNGMVEQGTVVDKTILSKKAKMVISL